MNEKCKFLANGVCASPINNKEIFCENIPAEWCYYKQLQELKDKMSKIQNRLSQIEYTASIDVRELRYDLIRIIENDED